MTTQALPKTNELIDEINSYVTQKRKPSDWQVLLLKKKAGGLKGKIQENLYYDVLGRIACLENNVEALKQYYQIALNLAPTDFQTQYHFLISLSNKGFYSKALAHGKKMLADFPDHSETTLSWLVGCAVLACRIYEAFDFLTQLNNPAIHECYQFLKEGKGVFETAGLNDDEAERLQNLAFSVMQKNKLYFSCTKRNIVRGCIHYQIYVDLPIEEIFDVNWQLADVLIENTENTHSDAILFEYESIDVFEENLDQ